MAISVVLAGLLLSIAGIMLIYWHPQSVAFCALLLAMAFQTAVRIVSRTFYAGAYALKRIFMPSYVVVSMEIMIFLAGWAARSWLTEFSGVFCVLAATVITAVIMYLSVRHVTDILRITPRKLFHAGLFKTVLYRHWNLQLALSALASLGMRMQEVLWLIMVHWLDTNESLPNQYLFPVYLILPFVRSSLSWAHVMYHDMAKYHLDIFAGFRRHLESRTLLFSVAVGAMFSLLSALTLYLATPEFWVAMVDVLIPVVIAGTVLGTMQMILFSRQDYIAVIITCIPPYTVFAMLYCVQSSLLACLLVSLVVSLGLGALGLSRKWSPAKASMQPLLPWVYLVSGTKHPLCVIALTFHPSLKRLALLRIADDIEKLLQSSCYICADNNNQLLISLPVSSSQMQRENIDDLISMAGGYVINAQELYGNNGFDICSQMLKAGMFAPVTEASHDNNGALAEIFRERFPQGFIQTPLSPAKNTRQTLARNEQWQILQQAIHGLNLETKSSGRKYSVTMAYEAQSIKTIFILDKKITDATARVAWEQLMHAHNLNKAIKYNA